MEKIHLIQRVLDYIDEHITEPLDAPELARLAGYSPFHFQRVFHKYTGTTLMDYVLKRRLQFALHDLANGRKIVDIALDYGFDTHAGFTKAFKKCFGSPPTLYRLHCPCSLPPKPDLKKIQKMKVGGLLMQPKIVERPAFKVIGKTFEGRISGVSSTRDYPAFWNRPGLDDGSVEKMLYQTVKPKKHGEYCINYQTGPLDETFTYLFAVEFHEGMDVPDGLTLLEIPAATYAVFRTPPVPEEEFFSSIRGTWRYILEEWFPQSSYEVDEGAPDFEYYDENCHYWLHEKIFMEIHIPVKGKERMES
jgi:Bacterial regulatory helix-turn-helix proteins, AraC family./Bacterial transcription activator, effector binding domain.